MKMKAACQAASLTERAVRLYVAKGLIAPGLQNGILHFTNADIRALQNIAALRRCGFSLEQIANMSRDAACIPRAIEDRITSAETNAEAERRVVDALRALRGRPVEDIGALAAHCIARQALPPKPNFARLDELSEDARRHQTREAATARIFEQKRGKRRLLLLGSCGVLAALLALILLFLNGTALSGYMPIAPATVLAVSSNGVVTLSIDDAWAADIIGKDTITIPFAAFAPLKAGERLTSGLQLAIRLTNLDLIRLGIHPFFLGGWEDTEVLNAQRKAVVRALFAGDPGDTVKLWIHETANLAPLFYADDQ